MASTQTKLLGPDGVTRRPEDEQKINELAVATFKGKGAQEFLRYLRSITIEAVGGPQITDAELRHREGMRYLVGIIEQRIDKGKQQ
jgi:hypothetical protein